jgi:hypothetical protein
LVAVAGYPAAPSEASSRGFARYGYAKSQHRYLSGARLVLLTDTRGLPLGYTIVSANEKVRAASPTSSPAPRRGRDRRQGLLGP